MGLLSSNMEINAELVKSLPSLARPFTLGYPDMMDVVGATCGEYRPESCLLAVSMARLVFSERLTMKLLFIRIRSDTQGLD